MLSEDSQSSTLAQRSIAPYINRAEIDEAADSALACSRRLKFGMRHKVGAAGEKNKEGEVERGVNLPLLCSTHAVFLFTSFCAVPRNWTPGTGLHGSVDLGNDYLTNRFHVAVRGAQVQQFQMKFCDLLVNRPRVTWNLYVLHNERKRNNDIIA